MNIYAGIFLTALATLAFEVTLTRILSVISWYHLAFFAVSTAMLGMTAGAVTVYVNKKAFDRGSIDGSASAAATAFGLSIPAALYVICFNPVVFHENLSSLAKILAASLACIVPFYFSGIVITALLTKKGMPTGRVYAADLAGASLGCLFVLFGLEILGAPDLVLMCAPVATLASWFLAVEAGKPRLKAFSAVSSAVLVTLLLANILTGFIYPHTIKENRRDKRDFIFQKWNSFSWVSLFSLGEGWPHFWAESPAVPRVFTARQYYVMIDGLAGTHIVGMERPEQVAYLKYDMVNMAYHFRPSPAACIIGVGGGRDVTSAVAFGAKSVTGLDVNPIFINDLLKDKYRNFANLAGRPEVELVADEARSYLARTKKKFDIIQMSLIDTWAATGAGAFSLTENGLYTVEAWKIFLDRLSDSGIFTVSRWFSPEQPGETARIVSLACASLFNRGVTDPSAHIVLASIGSISTLMVCARPFTAAELAQIRGLCEYMKFDIMVFPGQNPGNKYLNDIIAARSLSDLMRSVDGAPLNYRPPTDETPFFFNMLKLNHLDFVVNNGMGVLKGNLQANYTLILLVLVLLFFAAITIVLPLILGRAAAKNVRVHAAAYFCAIGAGFMLTEIAMIQKLSVFLGHPAYALGILLFSMIASAGAGSFLSEIPPFNGKKALKILPIILGSYMLVLISAMHAAAGAMVSSPMPLKIAAALGMIVPMGVMMGMFFPHGMRMLKSAKQDSTPWYWALNGITGVLCSALAVFISIYSSISMNLVIGALCYLSLLYFAPRMAGKRKN